MKAPSRLSLILLVAVFSDCGGPVLLVHRAPTAPVPSGDETLVGVPFYVKTAGCKHQTVWLQPVYTLTLKRVFTPDKAADKPQPEIKAYVVFLGLSQYRNDAVAALRALLSGSDQPSPKEVMDAWANVSALALKDPYSVDENQLSGADSGKVVRAANQVMVEKYVDYNTTYYYNTNRPLAGTAQATIKLGDDGTMTESSAQIESKTLQTFLDLLPVKDVLSKIASAYLAEAKAAQALPAGTYKFELATDTKIFRHTHEAMLKDHDKYVVPPCPEQADEVKAPYNVTVEDVTETKKDSGDGSTVRVSGSIVLPRTEQNKK